MANGPAYTRWALEPYSIGMKLRTLRTQKHLTLSRLALETGLSTALLSKLETDRMIPTLPTLANICRVYGVGLSYFFADAARHTLAITRKAHLIGNGRSQEVVKRVSERSRAACGPDDGVSPGSQRCNVGSGAVGLQRGVCARGRVATGFRRDARGAGNRRLRVCRQRHGNCMERKRCGSMPCTGGDAGKSARELTPAMRRERAWPARA